jgi:hypothetical protein
MMPKLTKAQRGRLEKLAAYLEGLPEDYRHFNMGVYVHSGSLEAEVNYALCNGGVASCGTVACALGHGPAAGILVPPRFISGHRGGVRTVNWPAYGDIFVGDDCQRDSWCFDGGWEDDDNSHWGAAARIRLLLDRDSPPGSYLAPGAKWPPIYARYRIDAKSKAAVS